MSSRSSLGSNGLKALLTFFIGGAAGGICFAFLITRKTLYHLWFTTKEWWVFTTWKFWFLWSALFLGTIAAFIVTRLQGSLRLPVTPWHRFFLAMVLTATGPASGWVSTVDPSLGFVLTPVFVALFLSLALFALTHLWHIKVAVLMAVGYFLAWLLAGIPDAVIGVVPPEWHTALEFLIWSPFLAVLWLLAG